MAKKKKSRNHRKRKGLFAVECVVLVMLSLVLVASIWAARKFSLINYTELDESKLHTADEYNNTNTTSAQTAAADDTTEEQADQSTDTDTTDYGLSGYELIGLVGIDTRDGVDAYNSDTMIICCLNHNEKTIKLVSVYRDTFLNVGEDYDGEICYTKANSAYGLGGAEQFLSMINLNFDLNCTEYCSVHFKALAETIELLGGLDIDMTREEVVHLNNYNQETAPACDMEYEEVTMPSEEEFDGATEMTFHLNGSQAVSYARIRYTSGNDFRRTARQRLVLEKTLEKAKQAGIGTMNDILNAVLPDVTTNLDTEHMLTLMSAVLSYNITDQSGFPFEHIEDDGTLTGNDNVVAVTLETNVIELHQFLFPDQEYSPSATVQEYSNYIINLTGLGVESIPTDSEDGQLPGWSAEAEAQEQAEAAAAAAAGQ